MNRSTLISLLLLLLGGGCLLVRGMMTEYGKVYVRETHVEVQTDAGPMQWTDRATVPPRDRGEPDVMLSVSRTAGLWVAALLTLCVFSFLYGDNVCYKLAESIFIGVSAAYAMVAGFWNEIVQNLFGRIAPQHMHDWGLVGLDKPLEPIYARYIALVFAVMMLMRLSPKGSWIGRWPLALFIGATAGLRLVAYFESDFVRQIQSAIVPLLVMTEGTLRENIAESLKNITMVVGLLSCLTYFFFSVEHSGAVHYVARLGILFLMVTFGASFAYTVMGRIALVAERFEFLLDDWLWLIDPLSQRAGL